MTGTLRICGSASAQPFFLLVVKLVGLILGLAGEAQAATATTPMDANIPESQQGKTPRVAVSFATISRPHTKDALETKDDVDDFLDAYRRELIAAIENGKKILL